jgi:hypothetical protein
MARKLRTITQAMNGHLAHRFGALDDLPKGQAPLADANAPAIRAAFLQGEALLTRLFFEFCEAKGFRDAESQMKIWDRLILRRHMFVELCERSNLNKYSRFLLPQDAGQSYKERCFKLYCLYLIDCEISAGSAKNIWAQTQALYQDMVLQTRS